MNDEYEEGPIERALWRLGLVIAVIGWGLIVGSLFLWSVQR
jgi:hypothetical protein